MSRAPYGQEISRQNKACFLFLLDQSFSMEEPLGNSSGRKCDESVAAINGWLENMAIRASGDEGIKDWMDVGVFGYRTDRHGNPDPGKHADRDPGPDRDPHCGICFRGRGARYQRPAFTGPRQMTA